MHHPKYGLYVKMLCLTFILLFISGKALSNPGDKPDLLRVGYMMVPNTVLVVKHMGWLEENINIPIKWVKYESGKHVLNAFEAKEIDLAHIGTTPCAEGISNGLPIEVIWIHEVIGDSEALVVKSNRKIEKINDFKGKKIAVPFGSTTHYHLKLALKLSNVQQEYIKIVNLDPEQMLNAWKNETIDAGFVWEPTLSKMVDLDGHILLTSKELANRGFPTADVCAARKSFSEKYSGIVTHFIKIMDKAILFYRSDRDRVIKIVANELKISANKATKQMEGLIFLSAEEQAKGKYIGEFQWNYGLYTLLKNTADFLEKEGEISASAPWPIFMRAVNPKYLKASLQQ